MSIADSGSGSGAGRSHERPPEDWLAKVAFDEGEYAVIRRGFGLYT